MLAEWVPPTPSRLLRSRTIQSGTVLPRFVMPADPPGEADLGALSETFQRQPVIAAYLAALRAADRRARAGSVRDLAGPFACRLDRGVLTATQNTRTAFKQAREDNLDDIVDEATIACTDRQGARWTLGAWAAMNAATTGRQATSRGVADEVGEWS